MKAECAARNKLEEAIRASGMTASGAVRGDDTIDRKPLLQNVYSGQPTSDESLHHLIGDAPLPDYNGHGDRYALETGPKPHDPLGMLPIPSWDGRDIALA